MSLNVFRPTTDVYSFFRVRFTYGFFYIKISQRATSNGVKKIHLEEVI